MRFSKDMYPGRQEWNDMTMDAFTSKAGEDTVNYAAAAVGMWGLFPVEQAVKLVEQQMIDVLARSM
jgi:hypothetical protein